LEGERQTGGVRWNKKALIEKMGSWATLIANGVEGTATWISHCVMARVGSMGSGCVNEEIAASTGLIVDSPAGEIAGLKVAVREQLFLGRSGWSGGGDNRNYNYEEICQSWSRYWVDGKLDQGLISFRIRFQNTERFFRSNLVPHFHFSTDFPLPNLKRIKRNKPSQGFHFK
jgi:hypothetical protein